MRWDSPRWPRNSGGSCPLTGKQPERLLLHAQVFSHLGTRLVRSGLRFYRRVLSPLLGPACRFYPSCSSYALAAVEKYGVLKGSGLALLRLAKCHPWHPGGIDPLC
ncbi:MAG: membrane protein insertion efficiency factor YidD [Deltaproteobacteria bacterium]|nr:MAG: membrane protein insertion efficiency factor YidD [Deltaproteobacteria bacterium]